MGDEYRIPESDAERLPPGFTELPDALTLFRWDILCDNVYEDYQGIWEPYWWLNGGGRARYAQDLNAHQRQVHAEWALRDLWNDGMIEFFRSGWVGDDRNAAAENPERRVPDKDVPGLLTARWWRRVPLPYADVYIVETAKGREFAEHLLPLMSRLNRGEFSGQEYRPAVGMQPIPDTSRARRDVECGRNERARQRLTGLLSWHGGAYADTQSVFHLLGEASFKLDRFADAGRFWAFTDKSGDEFDRAFAAFVKRYGGDQYQLWRQMSPHLHGRPLPAAAVKRIRAWERAAIPDPPPGWRSNVMAVGDPPPTYIRQLSNVLYPMFTAVEEGTNGYHIHFDDPTLSELVPDVGDLRNIDTARLVATNAARRGGKFAVTVPLPGMARMPSTMGVEDITALDPREPPAIYHLPVGIGQLPPGGRRFPIESGVVGVDAFIGVDPDSDHEIDPETPPFRACLYFVIDAPRPQLIL